MRVKSLFIIKFSISFIFFILLKKYELDKELYVKYNMQPGYIVIAVWPLND